MVVSPCLVSAGLCRRDLALRTEDGEGGKASLDTCSQAFSCLLTPSSGNMEYATCTFVYFKPSFSKRRLIWFFIN